MTPTPRQPSVLVFGHYLPPVTGERLCFRQLLDSLSGQHYPVTRCDKATLDCLVKPGAVSWLAFGHSLAGFVRDLAFLCIFRARSFFVLPYLHNRAWRRLALLGAWLPKTLRSRTLLVVLTEEIAERLRAGGWNAVVLRNTMCDMPESEPRPASRAKRLIWMGSLTREKGFHLACGAFGRLRSADPEWLFDIYGEGSLEPEARNEPGAVFHGLVTGKEKEAAFAGGGVLILPSHYVNETQPLSVIEAFYFGLPVVTSDIGGLPEMVGEGAGAAGIVVPRGCEAGDYLSAIRAVYEDYTLFAGNAHKRYQALFSLSAYEKQLSSIMAIASGRAA